MIGNLREGRRRMILGAVAGVAVVALAVGIQFLPRTPATPLLAQASPAAAGLAPANPLDDTALENWQIDVPEVPPPAPAKVAPQPAPRPDVNWNALALGVADTQVGERVGSVAPADIRDALSPEQARLIIARAEEEAAAKRGDLPRFVGAVVARGTPRGHGGGGRCD